MNTEYDPFEDGDCVSAYIEKNYDDFEMWCTDRGIHHDYYCDYEYDYCLQNELDFTEFGARFQEDLADREYDLQNDLAAED